MKNLEKIESIITFKTARSSGSGGQHVNKTESKVIGVLPIEKLTTILTPEELGRFKDFYKNKITSNGYITTASETHRSQHRNKKEVIEKLKKKIIKGIKTKEPRKKPKFNKTADQKRLDNKSKHSQKKKIRNLKNWY